MMIPKFLLPSLLLLLVAFTGLILIGRSIDEENKTLGQKILEGKSRRRIITEDNEVLHEINLLIKKYQSGNIPQLLPKLSPINLKLDETNLRNENSSPRSITTVSKKTKREYFNKHKLPVSVIESKSTAGYLNVHYWDSFCGSRIEDLKRNIHFPYYPSEKGNITQFYIQRYETGFGQRIIGYLHPPETGNFTFAISCDDNCEVWLSSSETPVGVTKIAYVGTFEEPANTKVADFQAYPSQISKPVHLTKTNRYYIEVLHKQGAYKDHVLLAWLAPSWERIRIIKSDAISSFIDVEEEEKDVNRYKHLIPFSKACMSSKQDLFNNSIYLYDRDQHSFTSYDYREDFFKTPTVNVEDFIGILPSKDYEPSYILDFKPMRYEGVNLMHESAVYPTDYTTLSHMTAYENCQNPRLTDSHFNNLPGFNNLLDEDDDYSEERVTSNFNDNEKNYTKPVFNVKKAAFHQLKSTSTQSPIAEKGSFAKRSVQSRKLLFLNTEEQMRPLKRKRAQSKFFASLDDRNALRLIKGARESRSSLQSLQQGKQLPRHLHYQTTESKLKHRMKINDRKLSKYSAGYSRSLYARRRKKNVYHFKNKVFFKDGELITSNSTIFDSKTMLIHFYPLFGTATYYLVQKPPRSFLWKYKTFLSKCRTDGNLALQEEVAIGVVQKYMRSVRKKHGSKYTLKKIVNVEENHDVVKGDRYLIEIELEIKGEALSRRLSKYIYRDLHSDEIFEPRNFVWDPQATVHVIVPVKNQGRWVQHFINNMEKIYLETQDNKLNVIIVDFNSTDIDIEESLKKGALKRYKFIQLGGAFQRALGLQAGAETIKNDDDIIFTCDLHLDIPPILIDTIRKHTIKKKLGFAPMVHRLSCGYTPELPYGLWEVEGYGLFSISKYDFDRIGGMNTKEFKTKWGGEDWEFLDRALGHGLEVDRLRVPNFFHHYHSKRKMWQASSTAPPSTTTTPRTTDEQS